jgi:TonB family protein
MNKRFNVSVLTVLSIFVLCAGALWASPDNIVVQVRLYQGFHKNGSPSGVVVTSYYLKKMDKGSQMIPFTEAEKEQESLKRIYNLKKVHKVAQLAMTLRKNLANKLEFPLKLNGRELWLTVANRPEKKDRFRIDIKEKDKKKVLMESEVIVPEKKTAVLGFKDSAEKIYFLAFNRQSKGVSLAQKLKAKSVQPPKLLYMKEPVYPGHALRKGISGEVVVAGKTDEKGRVLSARVLDGHPLLRTATLKALRTWKYSPWKIDGVPKPVHFNFIFIFALKGTKVDHDAIHDKYRPVLKANKIETLVPQILEMVLVTGNPGAKAKQEHAPDKGKTLAERLNAKTVEKPRAVRRPEPAYPAKAIKQGIEGTIVIHAVTNTEGKVASARVLTGPPLLRDASMQAAKRWQYTPWKVDGTAKPVISNLVFIYRLKQIPTAKIDSLVRKVLERLSPEIKKAKKKGNKIPMLQEVILIEGRKD